VARAIIVLSGAQPGSDRPMATSIPILLRDRGIGQTKDRLAWRLIDQTTEVRDTATFEELYQRSGFVARKLGRMGVEPGARIILLMDTRLEFYYALFGAMLIGALPVAVYPPLSSRNIAAALEHLHRVTVELEAAAIITTPELYAVAKLLPARRSLSILVAEDIGNDDGSGLYGLRPQAGDSPVLLQYTSGSMSSPRAVVLSTDAIVANLSAIGDAFQIRNGDVGLSWLPLYHDMGLHSVFFGLLFEMPAILMSPIDFMKKPSSWLRAISKYKVTHSPAPTFGYSYAARRIRDVDLKDVRLDSWRVAMCGAEPIDADILGRFAERFAAFGFHKNAYMAAYGLAENVVAVSFAEGGRGLRVDSTDELRSNEPVVSVGRPVVGHQIRIVADGDIEAPDGVVGEILVRGPSRMIGYWRDSVSSREVLQGDWLRTGDLGYIRNDELYITGRRKELIIRGGRNLYPHDIEAAATVTDVRRGSVAAFSVKNAILGTDDIIIVAETKRSVPIDNPTLIERIRTGVADKLNVAVRDVVLVKRGSVPKTSSGKIRRGECRARYEMGRLAPPAGPDWALLARIAMLRLLPSMVRRLLE
jgi:acyl-CoA synthetase (AMP-forming)/AMP-acid ligase II